MFIDPRLRLEDLSRASQYLLDILLPTMPEKGLSTAHRTELLRSRILLPRMILQHQLHSVLTAHSHIDREIEERLIEGSLLKIQIRASAADGEIQAGGSDFGLIQMDKYLQLVITASQDAVTTSEDHDEALRKFHSIFLRRNGIVRSGLIKATYLLEEVGLSQAQLRFLVNKGFLVLSSHLNSSTLAVSIPNSGLYVKSLLSGRRQILKHLKRQPYNELLEKSLGSRKMKDTLFSWIFHLHDLVGSGRVEIFKTPAGRGIKATPKGLATLR